MPQFVIHLFLLLVISELLPFLDTPYHGVVQFMIQAISEKLDKKVS